MKKILLSLAAAAAVASVAAPASAQPWRDHDDGYGHHQSQAPYRLTTPYVDGLEWKINNAAREGRISWADARDMKHDLRQVKPIAWRVQTGQAGRWEIERLDRAVSRIERAVGGHNYAYRDNRGDDGYYGWRR
jgi:hypothetical protein